MTHVAFSQVGKTYTGRQGAYEALQGINLEIQRGTFVSLIGHSGCGKSTLLSMLAGLSSPTAGTVTLSGKAIKGPGPDRALVFQQYSLLPWLSVYANIYEAVDAAMGKAPRSEKEQRASHYLNLVGLWEHRSKRPHQISGGMKQRVAIARAMAVHPEVLLLDEPFGALDALTRSDLQDELLTLWSQARTSETVVMVTHDIDEALYLSDRIIVMSNGPAATVAEDLAIGFPRPRNREALVSMPEYAETKAHLLHLLTVTLAQHRPSRTAIQPEMAAGPAAAAELASPGD